MKERLRRERLITPYREERVKNCSYELSLGMQVFVTGDDETRREIKLGKQIRIPPGQFANLLTEEIVKVPDDALGLISMKFKLKQPGLVNVSGFHVDPGYSGKLLFSVYNAGPQAVPITSGKPAFLLWYCSLDRETSDGYKKPPRMEITDADVKHLGGEVATPQALVKRIEKVEQRVSWRITALQMVVAAGLGAGLTLMVDGIRATQTDNPVPTTTVPSPTSTSTPGAGLTTTTV